jgi:hypothetical protein
MKCNGEQIITPEMITKTKQAEMGCLVFVIISGAGKYFFSSCHN